MAKVADAVAESDQVDQDLLIHLTAPLPGSEHRAVPCMAALLVTFSTAWAGAFRGDPTASRRGGARETRCRLATFPE
jgi:hypothetical protein